MLKERNHFVVSAVNIWIFNRGGQSFCCQHNTGTSLLTSTRETYLLHDENALFKLSLCTRNYKRPTNKSLIQLTKRKYIYTSIICVFLSFFTDHFERIIMVSSHPSEYVWLYICQDINVLPVCSRDNVSAQLLAVKNSISEKVEIQRDIQLDFQSLSIPANSSDFTYIYNFPAYPSKKKKRLYYCKTCKTSTGCKDTFGIELFKYDNAVEAGFCWNLLFVTYTMYCVFVFRRMRTLPW